MRVLGRCLDSCIALGIEGDHEDRGAISGVRFRVSRVCCSCAVALASPGCARADIARLRHCARSEVKPHFLRRQALRCTSSIAVVVLSAARRIAGVQARPRAGLDSAAARHRPSVATDTPICWDTREIRVLSGGSSRATTRCMNSFLYRATVAPRCPLDYRGIDAATTLTRGAFRVRTILLGYCECRLLDCSSHGALRTLMPHFGRLQPAKIVFVHKSAGLLLPRLVIHACRV